MEFYKTDIYLPVDEYRFEVTVETPRTPTAFEWAAVRIVRDFGGDGEFSSATVVDVFRTVFGVEGVGSFIESAVKELFSPTVNVFRTENFSVAKIMLPIREIQLTEDGERMLATGKLPSAPKSHVRIAFHNPITGELLQGDGHDAGPLPEGARAPIREIGVAANPPEEKIREEEQAKLPDGVRVGRITALGGANRLWRRQRVSFALDGGSLRLVRDAKGIFEKTADYLESLTPELAKALFFAQEADSVAEGDEVVALPEDGLVKVYAPGEFRNLAPTNTRVVVKSSAKAVSAFIPSAVEIVKGGELRLEVDEELGILRLTAPAAGFPLAEGAVSDLATEYASVRTRVYYSGMPIELPVVCELAYDAGRRSAMAAYLDSLVAALPEADGLLLAFKLAENHASRMKAVENVIARGADDARLQAVGKLVDALHRSGSYADMHAVVDGLFGFNGRKAFTNIEAAEDFAAKLALRDEERRWVKGALKRFAFAVSSFGGGGDENEFVRVEYSPRGNGGSVRGRNFNKAKSRKMNRR